MAYGEVIEPGAVLSADQKQGALPVVVGRMLSAYFFPQCVIIMAVSRHQPNNESRTAFVTGVGVGTVDHVNIVE